MVKRRRVKKGAGGQQSHSLSATQSISSMERRFTRETSEDIPGLGRILILCKGLRPQPGRLRLSGNCSVSPALSAPAEHKGTALRGRRAGSSEQSPSGHCSARPLQDPGAPSPGCHRALAQLRGHGPAPRGDPAPWGDPAFPRLGLQQHSAHLRASTPLGASVSPLAPHRGSVLLSYKKLEGRIPGARGATADPDGSSKRSLHRRWERFSPDQFCPGRGRTWQQDGISTSAELWQGRASSAPACSPHPASTFPWRQLLAPNGAPCLQLYPDPCAKLEWH